jgi:lysophospholipase L1-like esterase
MMNRRILYLVLMAALFFAVGVASRPALGRLKARMMAVQTAKGTEPDGKQTDPPNDPLYYARRSSQFEKINKTQKFVFLGDSRIDCAVWSELFGNCEISNRGISGDTTAGILQRLPTSVPDDGVVCIIQAGVNDLSNGYSPDFVVNQYRDILNYLLVQKHSKVIVTSVMLVGQNKPSVCAAINECNRKLQGLVSGLGAAWVDVNPPICTNGFLSAQYSNDGVHLNGDGYEVLVKLLTPYLNPQ